MCQFKKQYVKAKLPLAILVAATAYGGGASAEEAKKLDEVVVTAQRKVELLQDVPIAINAFNAEQLENAGIGRTDDLAKLAPTLKIATSLGSALVFMRGVGTYNGQAGSEAGVAFYIDDVYYAESSGVLTGLANAEHIEVLKGPQGTLYGRNATGGLIHVQTPDPQSDPMLRLKIGYESYDTILGSMYASAGLTDTLKASISAEVHQQNDGYGDNVTLDKDANYLRYHNFRTKFVWDPSDDDRVTVSGSYFKDTSDSGFTGAIMPGTITAVGGTYPGNRYDTRADVAIDYENEAYGGSVKWEHTFSDGTVFKSLSAYNEVHADGKNFDADQDAFPLVRADFTKDHWAFQQEFLLQGETDNLDYTAGLYYFTDQTKFPLTSYSPTPLGTFALIQDPKTNLDSYSAFGQVDYQLTASDTLTVGLRYTVDKQMLDASNIQEIVGFGPIAPIDAADKDKTFESPSWRLAYKHDFGDDLMAYGSYSRGFRSGLFDPFNPNAKPVDPEVLDAYELGIKGEFADRTLQLGANAFYYDYSDMQVQSFQGVVTRLENAGSSEIFGLEVDALLEVPVPVGDLKLRANGSVMHDEFTKFKGCTVNAPNAAGIIVGTPGQDCTGNKLPFAPDWELNAGINYTIPVGSLGGEVGLDVAYHHSDGYFYSSDNVFEQPSYDTVDASISYAFANGRSRVRLYGNNLTDETVISVVNVLGGVGAWGISQPPRVFGVDFQHTWE